MSHLSHIQKYRPSLDMRWQLLRQTREFFWSKGFTEIETPLIVQLPGQEPYLSPVPVKLHNEQGQSFDGYLHTSPEYTMKKMIAAGYEKIFFLGKTLRDHESFGGMHNPEFTMIEWYRAHEDMGALMRDVEELFANLGYKKSFERVHMKQVWKEYAGLDLDTLLTVDTLLRACINKGYRPDKSEQYEDLFYRIFLNEVEPRLAECGPLILHHYPAQMAALSNISEQDPNYAERFEVYVDGVEIANAFTELTDADEQLERLREEQNLRQKLGKPVYMIDMEFIDALRSMPPSAGIALGFDRLVQVFTGCKNIDDVLVLPASKLFL